MFAVAQEEGERALEDILGMSGSGLESRMLSEAPAPALGDAGTGVVAEGHEESEALRGTEGTSTSGPVAGGFFRAGSATCGTARPRVRDARSHRLRAFKIPRNRKES